MTITIDDLHPVVLFLGVSIIVFNLIVTRALILDGGPTKNQKFAQTLIVWIIPFLGAGFILVLIGSHHSTDEMKTLAPFPFYLASYKKSELSKVTDSD